MTALDLARQQYNAGDNMFRAGVKVRLLANIRRTCLDADSAFIKAVSDERNNLPLP
jgi:hypothetical protein